MQKQISVLLILCDLAFCIGNPLVAAPGKLEKLEQRQPNLIVMILDDLNDWTGTLKGYSGVHTPNLDRLAAEGITFTNAHAQAPFCGPSRNSFLSGLNPWTTGSYEFEPYGKASTLTDQLPFPFHFRKAGYRTIGGGKIFHEGTGDGWVSESWEQVIHTDDNPMPSSPIHWPKSKWWDWGPWPEADAQMGDYQLAEAATEFLHSSQDMPFLMVLGFHRPHVPLHVPESWFDLYPIEEIRLPVVPEDDLDDVPHPEIGLRNYAAPNPGELAEWGLTKSLVQAYLASISFADYCVGEVMDGLEKGPNAENTMVILTSDHGFHLGEKQHWAKRTLWEETTRIPLLVSGPSIPENTTLSVPVGLIDLYPTLCELAGLATPGKLDGSSLVPILRDPSVSWDHPALTTFKPGQFSVRSERWRYIRYEDGTEELYDHSNDPNEWKNLASQEQWASVREELKGWIPESYHPGL